jgi:imidazole glycerol-phosphate synthase subunit HisF
MKNIRIIARLDIKGPNLVKGIHLEGLRVLGRPEEFAKYYYENGADELIYQDVVASLYERNSLKEMISNTAREIFIPLTVGGGIRTIDDIKQVLRAGADKVCLNTAAIKNPKIIRDASRIFGSSTIVAGIEAIRQSNGIYKAYTDNGREETGRDVEQWAIEVAEMGAGEILLTSVDKEGTGEGFDIDLVKRIATAVSIPVIAHGGAGNKDDVKEVVDSGRCDAVAIAGMFHYARIKQGMEIVQKHGEGNYEYISRQVENKTYKDAVSISNLKQYLKDHGVQCRA